MRQVKRFVVTYTKFKTNKNNKGVKDGSMKWDPVNSQITLYDEGGSMIEKDTIATGAPVVDEDLITEVSAPTYAYIHNHSCKSVHENA